MVTRSRSFYPSCMKANRQLFSVQIYFNHLEKETRSASVERWRRWRVMRGAEGKEERAEVTDKYLYIPTRPTMLAAPRNTAKKKRKQKKSSPLLKAKTQPDKGEQWRLKERPPHAPGEDKHTRQVSQLNHQIQPRCPAQKLQRPTSST